MLCPILYNIRWCVWKEFRSLTNQIAAMKTNYYFRPYESIFLGLKYFLNYRLFIVLFILSNTFFGYSQALNSNLKTGYSSRTITLKVCIKDLGNGLYSATFGYNNPNDREITIDIEDSYIRYYNGNEIITSPGINKFKKGNVENAFTRQFMASGYVKWTVKSPNGYTKHIKAYQSCSFCQDDEIGGIIFPLYDQGDGKDMNVLGLELNALAVGNAGLKPFLINLSINQ